MTNPTIQVLCPAKTYISLGRYNGLNTNIQNFLTCNYLSHAQIQKIFSGAVVQLQTRVGMKKFYYFKNHTLENQGGVQTPLWIPARPIKHIFKLVINTIFEQIILFVCLFVLAALRPQ